MIWNDDRDMVSSRNEISMLRLLECTLFEDLSRMRYLESIGTLELHRWRVSGGESWRMSI